MKKLSVKIACVGGGLAGSLAAIALMKALSPYVALEFHVFEQFSNPFLEDEDLDHNEKASSFLAQYDARNIVLSSATIQFLKHLGVWAELSEFLVPIHQLHISKHKSFAKSQIIAKDEHVEALGYVADLGALSLAFQRLAEGAIFHYQATMEGLKPTQTGYSLRWREPALEDIQTLEAHLVLGADGQFSWVGKTLRIPQTYKSYQQKALVCNLDVSSSMQQLAYERFLSDGAITLLPLNHGQFQKRMSLVWIGPVDKVDQLCDLTDEMFLEELSHLMGGAFIDQTVQFVSVGRRQTYSLGQHQMNERVRPHCVFIGNASQALHPIAAQGFNLAVRDIRDLSKLLANQLLLSDASNTEAFPAPGLLQNFSAMRSADVEKVKFFVETLVKTFFKEEVGLSRFVQSNMQTLGLALFELLPGAKPGLSRFAMGGRAREAL